MVPRARPLLPRPGNRALAARIAGVLLGACLLLVTAVQPARAGTSSAAQDAARVAVDRGYRTGVAVLDLTTGAYSGAGEDTAEFPSQSVVKVLIATQLLLTGQLDGATQPLASRMITASDDGAADALYARAGGDRVVDLVAAHYGIPDLGEPPPIPGRWGLTRITARGLVQLYAALAKDPAVFPWLGAAMAAAVPIAADGTSQFFGIPAATSGAAIKQGWGHDGVDAGNAVANSTGYVDGGRVAVAILSAGPAATYGAAIQGTVTAQAQALLAGSAAAVPPSAPATGAVAAGAAAAAGAAGATDTAQASHEGNAPLGLGALALAGAASTVAAAVYGGRRVRGRLRRRAEERRLRKARRRRRRAPAGRTRSGATPTTRLVRLPSGQLVRISVPPGRPSPAGRPSQPGHPAMAGRPSQAARPAMAVRRAPAASSRPAAGTRRDPLVRASTPVARAS